MRSLALPHGHVDESGGTGSFLNPSSSESTFPDVFLLAPIEEGLRLLIWAFEHIDGSNLHANLIGLQPSDSSFHKLGNH